jgi:hypothetical protein
METLVKLNEQLVSIAYDPNLGDNERKLKLAPILDSMRQTVAQYIADCGRITCFSSAILSTIEYYSGYLQ